MVTTEEIKSTMEKVWSLTKEDYKKLGSFKHWKDFSLTPDQSEEDIRFCAVVSAVTERKCNPLCYTYICEKQNMTDDLIKELMFLSSGVFRTDLYTPENIEVVSSIISIYNYRTRNILEQWKFINWLYSEGKISDNMMDRLNEFGGKPITDCLDWYALSKNSKYISREFYQKFKLQFNIAPFAYSPEVALRED